MWKVFSINQIYVSLYEKKPDFWIQDRHATNIKSNYIFSLVLQFLSFSFFKDAGKNCINVIFYGIYLYQISKQWEKNCQQFQET